MTANGGGGDSLSMRVFIPKRWSILYGPMTVVAGVYPDPAKGDALDCFEVGLKLSVNISDLAKSSTRRFDLEGLSIGKRTVRSAYLANDRRRPLA
jgi:hypothetical protein